MDKLKKVDHGAMVANQIVIIVLTILAFVLDRAWLAGFVAVVMALGTLVGRPGFLPVYTLVFKPLGLVKPHVLLDNPEPHRFAQGFGAVVLGAGSALLLGGLAVAGWSLVWLVVALAALNAFAGFCAGCFMYYWLTRFKVPGFSKTPPEGTFPGMRPRGVVAP
jgi:hypothetical protein